MEREISQDQSRARELALKQSETLMTQETQDRLSRELVQWRERLKSTREGRTRIQEDFRDAAAAHQSQLELLEADAKVNEIDRILKQSKLLTPRIKTDKIKLGNSALVRLVGEDASFMVTMLGKHDIGVGIIHPGQPLADAIYGKTAGDKANYTGGYRTQMSIEILQVLPGQFEGPKRPQKS